jgi:hypothetical protein
MMESSTSYHNVNINFECADFLMCASTFYRAVVRSLQPGKVQIHQQQNSAFHFCFAPLAKMGVRVLSCLRRLASRAESAVKDASLCSLVSGTKITIMLQVAGMEDNLLKVLKTTCFSSSVYTKNPSSQSHERKRMLNWDLGIKYV